jgi:hypothetical protein
VVNPTTFPVSAGLLEPKHVRAIDAFSPWPVYLWFLNRVTSDVANGDEFDGIVLYGNPVGVGQISAELGIEYRQCRRYISRLKRQGYIAQTKTGTGMCTYLVKKSKKWLWKRNGAAATDQNHVAGIPTDQNHACGSMDPEAKIVSLGDDPQTNSGTPTGQNRVSAIRNKPQETTKNPKPQTSLVLLSEEPPPQKNAFFPDLMVEEQSKAKPTSKTNPSVRRTRACEMPEAFTPNDSHRKLASELGVNLEECFVAFADFHASKGNKFKNWDLALNTWLRNEVKFARNRDGNGTRKSSSRHTDLEKIDYKRGLGEMNADGAYKM